MQAPISTPDCSVIGAVALWLCWDDLGKFSGGEFLSLDNFSHSGSEFVRNVRCVWPVESAFFVF